VNSFDPTHDGRPVARRSMLVPLAIVVLATVVVIGAILGFKAFVGAKIGQFMAAAAHAPQTVSTVTAARSSWHTELSAVGSLRAVRGADLSAQIAGIVDEIDFDSGNDVPAGKRLLTLRPYDDPAKLAQLEAAAELARQNLKRDREQFEAQAVSQATIDSDVSTLKSDEAQVEAQRRIIQEKTVRAPFAGRLGIRQIDVGQYLNAGTAIVTLQQLDPILVDFYVPQQALAQARVGSPVTARIDTYPGVEFTGAVESLNSKVDTTSRNVQVRASFRNPDKRLLPGMFAVIALQAGAPRESVTLPQTCITYNPYGDTVYVVKHGGATGPDGKTVDTVEQRFVTLGETRGDQVEVLTGVSAGEVIVAAGQMKLRNGTSVVVDNSIQPPDQVRPTPPNE